MLPEFSLPMRTLPFARITDGHAYDRAVLQDCLDLGGVGEPDWRKQE